MHNDARNTKLAINPSRTYDKKQTRPTTKNPSSLRGRKLTIGKKENIDSPPWSASSWRARAQESGEFPERWLPDGGFRAYATSSQPRRDLARDETEQPSRTLRRAVAQPRINSRVLPLVSSGSGSWRASIRSLPTLQLLKLYMRSPRSRAAPTIRTRMSLQHTRPFLARYCCATMKRSVRFTSDRDASEKIAFLRRRIYPHRSYTLKIHI